MRKTIAELIDELSITNVKVALMIEKVNRNEHTKEEAYKMNKLVQYRSKLKNAINEYFGEDGEVKT